MPHVPSRTDDVSDVGRGDGGVAPGLGVHALMAAEVLERSFRRCRGLGLAVDQPAHNEPLPATALKEVRERHDLLLHLATPELNTLFEAMTAADGIVLLTDPQGLILDARGDTGFLARARRVALLPGADWSEAREGTNAIGTALAESALVEVIGSQHFLQDNHFLVCTAMPIQDPCGRTAGVLDLSGDVRNAHPHTRTLLRLAVTNLEHRWVLHTAQAGDEVVHLHPHPAWLNTPHEGVLIFRHGVLVASNRAGRRLAGLSDHAAIRLQELFGEALSEGDHQLHPPAGDGPLQARVRRQAGGLHHAQRTVNKTGAGSPPGQRYVQVEDEVLWDSTTLALRRKAERALQASIPLLLQGETGTGKEMFVRSVHRGSARAARPLVAINCAAIPESLFEAELFGYRAGAFTGAHRNGSAGRLLEADGGILFLDEIGDMPLSLQGRLLRVLQDRMVQPLGGGKPSAVDFLLITATHRPLDREVSAGRFRADLYYRIRHLTLSLPPLRERGELPAILDTLLLTLGANGRNVRLSPAARARLLAHDWPGNFRELVSLLRTLIALAEDGSTLECDDLPSEFQQPPARCAAVPQPLRQSEFDSIQQALLACNGNISAAARHLGIHRTTLHRKLKQRESEAIDPGARAAGHCADNR